VRAAGTAGILVSGATVGVATGAFAATGSFATTPVLAMDAVFIAAA
jgi:hypothetical protein